MEDKPKGFYLRLIEKAKNNGKRTTSSLGREDSLDIDQHTIGKNPINS